MYHYVCRSMCFILSLLTLQVLIKLAQRSNSLASIFKRHIAQANSSLRPIFAHSFRVHISMTLPSDNEGKVEKLNAYLEERGYNLEQKEAVRNLFEANSLLDIAGKLQTKQLLHHRTILTSFTDWEALPKCKKCAGMKGVIKDIRSGTLICSSFAKQLRKRN